MYNGSFKFIILWKIPENRLVFWPPEISNPLIDIFLNPQNSKNLKLIPMHPFNWRALFTIREMKETILSNIYNIRKGESVLRFKYKQSAKGRLSLKGDVNWRVLWASYASGSFSSYVTLRPSGSFCNRSSLKRDKYLTSTTRNTWNKSSLHKTVMKWLLGKKKKVRSGVLH